MKTIPFDLEKAKAGAKVVTRVGEPVRLVCFDGQGMSGAGIPQPVIDSVGGCYCSNGRYYTSRESDADLFLVAPEPKLRPWKPEEVPVGAVLSWGGGMFRVLITEVSLSGVHAGNARKWTLDELFEDGSIKHSVDGKTWSRCGVVEE